MKQKNLKRNRHGGFDSGITGRAGGEPHFIFYFNLALPYKNGGGRRAVPNQRVCDFADPPTEEEGGGNPKKVAQCKRVKFGGRRAGPTRQYNSRGVQWGLNPAIQICGFRITKAPDTQGFPCPRTCDSTTLFMELLGISLAPEGRKPNQKPGDC